MTPELQHPHGVVPAAQPFVLPPTYRLTLARDHLDELQRLSCDFVSALLKVAYGVVHERPGFPALRELGLAPQHAELLRSQRPEAPEELLVIGRLDVATDGHEYVAYELNGDQPGGLEYVSLAEDGLALPAGGGLPSGSPYRAYLEAALGHFRRRSWRASPRGVLLLGNGYHLLGRLREAVERFFECPVHVRDLAEGCDFDGTWLRVSDDRGQPHPVDLVLRSPRVNIYELCSPELQAVRRAWEQGAAIIVNPPHSRVAGCKALLPALREEAVLARAQVTSEEADAVTRLLPEVVPVTHDRRAVLSWQRTRWVLKAPLGGKGAQVFLGPVTAAGEWDRVLRRAIREPGWTASAFRPPFQHTVVLEDSGREVRTPASTDPYVVVGEGRTVAGILSRAVIPQTGDPAELREVKLNLLGDNTYVGSDGQTRRRIVGLGRVRSA